MTTDTAARVPFAPETAVVVNFGGAIGAKQGHVVTDEGGATIEVRYAVKAGEKLRTVKAELVSPAVDEPAVDEPAVDDVPVRDVAEDQAADETEAAPADTVAAPAPAGAARPKDRELLSYAQDLVIKHGPTAILDGGLADLSGWKRWANADGVEILLDDDERAHLERHALYQAGRVRIFFGRSKPEGHDARRYA